MRKIVFVLLVALFAPICVKAQIYYNDVKLTKSRIIGSKVGNIVGAYFTLGLSPANSSKTIEGRTSETKIENDTKPKFKFVFGQSADSLLFNASNMEQIIMVKLHEKKKERQLRTGKYGLTGVETKISSKGIMPLSTEQVGKNEFMVWPKEELEKGEYCFYYLGKDFKITSVYDFTIK